MILKNDFNLLEHIKKDVFIIAEIGKNFIQSEIDDTPEIYLKNAKALILAAKESGADAVKFQTHNFDDEQLNLIVTAPHFSGSDRYAWVKRNSEATPPEFWKELKEYADELGIIFFSTPMSRGAAKKLTPLNLPLWKVGSGDLLDFVLLDYLVSTKKPIIVSSGMSTSEEVDRAIAFLKERDAKVVLLHCVSQYPVLNTQDFNLATIPYFQKKYGVPIGFSDHSLETEPTLAAVQLGACVIEKHFSFSRDLWGSDHKVSLNPDEFSDMVKRVRANEKVRDINIYGKEEKVLQEEEMKFRPIFRKSLVAAQNLAQGTVITKDMVYAMRPQLYSQGLPSEYLEEVLGKTLKKDLKRFEGFTREILQ